MANCSTYLRYLCLGSLSLGLLVAGPSSGPAERQETSLHDLSMEVDALQILHVFQFTRPQLEALQKLAGNAAEPAGARPRARVSPTFRDTLVSLREALVNSAADARIDQLHEKLEKLRAQEKPELDDSFEMTESACRKARAALRLLSARQVAAYVAGFGDEFPDPRERLLLAIEQVRHLGPREWKQARDTISEEIARLTAGVDLERADKISEEIVQFLIHTRSLSEADFKKQLSELKKAGLQILGEQDPVEVLRHAMERAMAELLSNPRLEAALAARLSKRGETATPVSK